MPITTHAHDRLKSTGNTKKRKETDIPGSTQTPDLRTQFLIVMKTFSIVFLTAYHYIGMLAAILYVAYIWYCRRYTVVVFAAVVVIVFVLTFTRTIKSVVTGQAPATLELRNTPGRKHKPKVVHAYITAEAIHASARNILKVKSGDGLRCVRSILVHTVHYSRLEKPTIPLATQKKIPCKYYT